MRVDFFPPFFLCCFFFLIVFLVQACLWIHLLHIQIKEDHRHQAIYRFTVDSCFNQQRCFTGTFVHGPVDSFNVAAGSDLRHKDCKRNKDTVFPSCSSSQAGFCSDSGSQSYKTTRTYLTFFSKIHPVSFGNVCNATEPRKTLLSPPPWVCFLLSHTTSPLLA